MFENKITVAVTVLLAFSCLTAGGSLLTYQSFKAEEPKPPSSSRDAEQTTQGKKQKANRKPVTEPSRAERLKAIREAYTKERDEFSKAIRAGKIKEDADGKYPGWAEMVERYAKPARKLIDEDSADEVACDALVFCLTDLWHGGYAADPGLYQLLLEHHATSEKIAPVLGSAPTDFLRAVPAKSPHANIRLWASYHLAEKLFEAGKKKEAEALLEIVSRDEQAKKVGGYVMGNLADTSNRLLFEIRRLQVGQEIPEIDGTDLDGKPLKLSESRGKVTLLVFWATWCMPCMNMVPHERALAERYSGEPFIIVGVNGDGVSPDAITLNKGVRIGRDRKVYDADGKLIGDIKDAIEKGFAKKAGVSAGVKAAVGKHKISWRSFRSGQAGMALSWNVHAWPTIFLIDHRGVIRGKWQGDPGEKTLDTAIDDLVKLAENAKDRK